MATLTVLPGTGEARGLASNDKVTSVTSTEQACMWLRQFQWQNRLLVITAPDQANQEYQRQCDMMKDQVCEMALRNVTVVSLFSNDAASSNVKVMEYSESKGEIQESAVPDTIVNSLIKYLDLPANKFGMVLLGKDGIGKERYPRPTATTSVFSKIDRMPMRRRETREKEAVDTASQ